MTRNCWICEAPITACMGFVAAGDLIDFWNGERKNVRETCELCVLRYTLAEENNLPKPFLLPNEMPS